MNPQTKKCSKCKQFKLLDEFRNQKKGKFGKKNYCIECDNNNARELYEKHKEYRKLLAEIWNENNPEKVKEYQKKFKEKNNKA